VSPNYGCGRLVLAKLPPTCSNPFQYTGSENESNGLYYYRARYYNPTIGDSSRKTRLGCSAGSTIRYVGDDPEDSVDPFGWIRTRRSSSRIVWTRSITLLTESSTTSLASLPFLGPDRLASIIEDVGGTDSVRGYKFFRSAGTSMANTPFVNEWRGSGHHRDGSEDVVLPVAVAATVGQITVPVGCYIDRTFK